jgi:alpha-galactosidase
MGWNTWNTFGWKDVCEEVVIGSADTFIRQGLKDAGYQYIVIDDCWHLKERDKNGRMQPDPSRFPRGIKPVADYIHSLGLKFGIYSCAGHFTCGSRAGSFGYEETDAQTFADWGVDFLKYDFCFKPPGGPTGPQLYFRMGQALRATGRKILFSACEWGSNQPWTWAASAGCHMWRTTGDIWDTWQSMENIGFSQDGKQAYAGPDHWNDPDMLVVGMGGKGYASSQGGMTEIEYRTHFALWCMLAAPLMIGCDVRNMTPATKQLLTHKGLIAINQDPMGRQGWRVGIDGDKFETWMKPMADGSIAVGLFNRHESQTRDLIAAWEAVGLHDRRACRVVDVFSGEELGAYTRVLSVQVPPHGCRILRLYPLPLT